MAAQSRERLPARDAPAPGPGAAERSAVPEPARGGALGPAAILALQRSSGNAAVGSLLLARAPGRRLLARSPKNPFDEKSAFANGAEAAKALNAYKALSPPDRRNAVAASYKVDLVLVLSALSGPDKVHTFAAELREILRIVEELETRASAGMTDDQIAAEQAAFMIKEAAAAAKAAADAAAKAKGVAPKPPTPAEIEKARKDAVAASSIPKSKVTWWSTADQPKWLKRGAAAIDAVVKHAAAHHPELGITPANFKLDFPGIEARGAGVVAAGSPAQVGKAFVEAVELNPAYVMDVVVHEVFGHPEYGTYGSEYHLALYDLAQTKVPGYVKPAAGSAERTTELDAFAYQETEIYAVLRSMAYRTAPAAKDAGKVPALDTQVLVTWHVETMTKQWSPKLIVPVLRGLRRRLIIDPRINVAALKVFDNAVNA
jgi:hypothetical protein